MKLCRRCALWLLFVALVSIPLSGETWYIRHDGGTRYSANAPKGQCDGKADLPYHGKGVNQHCAFKDYRYLWDDQSYNSDKWVIAGGDTVIVRNGPWRVGWDAATCPVVNGATVTVGCGAGYTWGLGGAGTQNPPLPAGTAEHHTRILGENYANCSAAGATDRKKLTQIFGGFGIVTPLDLSGAQFVDVECIEVTRHSQCIVFGSPANPASCNRSTPLDDFDSDGVHTDVNTHDLLLQDMWIHGHTGRGIKGPIGGTVTCERCDIAYNGAAGWDFDNGNGTASVHGVWNFNHSTIEWNGCNQAYPGTGAISCYGQSNGGYGDGVGTPAGMCLAATIDHSAFNYNTQDGLDLGHGDTGTGCPLKITNSYAIGNGGATFKWGGNENPAVFTNNIAIANCMRMSAPIAGAAANYNAHLGDFCRALDALPFDFRQGGTLLFANNTIISYAPTTFDIACWDPSCSNSVLTFKNNIVLGYDNPKTYDLGGKSGGPGLFYLEKSIGHTDRSNNLFFGFRGVRCPTGHPYERCDDPKFVSQPRFTSEQDLDRLDLHLSPASPARGSGLPIPSVSIDYEGKPRPSSGNPDMGAYQH
jgi:hypothetical protein